MRGLRARHAIYLAATLALAIALAYGFSASWVVERELRLTRGTGWAAIAALLFAMVTSACGKLAEHALRRPLGAWIPEIRRAFGISAAVLALVHASIALATYLRGSLADLLAIAWLRAGVLALAILLPLLLTSFPTVVRQLRVKLWKPLHRLAYVAVLLVAQHTLLSPLAPRGLLFLVFGVTLLVGLLRFLPGSRVGRSKGAD